MLEQVQLSLQDGLSSCGSLQAKKVFLQFSPYIARQQKTKLPKTIALTRLKYSLYKCKLFIWTVYPQVNILPNNVILLVKYV